MHPPMSYSGCACSFRLKFYSLFFHLPLITRACPEPLEGGGRRIRMRRDGDFYIIFLERFY